MTVGWAQAQEGAKGPQRGLWTPAKACADLPSGGGSGSAAWAAGGRDDGSVRKSRPGLPTSAFGSAFDPEELCQQAASAASWKLECRARISAPRAPGTASSVRGSVPPRPGPPRGVQKARPGQDSSRTWGTLPLPRRPGPVGCRTGAPLQGQGLKHPRPRGHSDLPPPPRAPRSLAPLRSTGPQATWPVSSGGVRPGAWLPAQRVTPSQPLPHGLRRAALPAAGAGPGSRGQERPPRPGGVSGRPRRHLKDRAGRGRSARAGRRGRRATGAGSGAGFESAPLRDGRGAMASSGPAGPLLLLLVLLLGARAGLPFRPGRGCYRAPRGDRLAALGRRSAAGGCARSRLLGAPCPP